MRCFHWYFVVLRVSRQTSGALAPEHHAGLLDTEAVVVRRYHAGRTPCCARYIDHRAAAAAHQVVVIVMAVELIPGRARSHGDAANQVSGFESREHIVDGLV